MADMRRRGPEPLPGMPRIEHSPGMADELMRELAPLMAEEGIDLDNIPDTETLQRALDRATERRNMQLFTPVGECRDIALVTLRLVVEAILDGNTALAGALLEQVVPESAANSAATVASCIGIALGLLDEWLSGRAPQAPAGLGNKTTLPSGRWNGERAANDVLALARKGRAFRSLQQLIVRQGSPQLLPGSALALAAAVDAWVRATAAPRSDVIRDQIQ